MREGARASHITRVVAELNDRLMAKILELAQAKLGPPPAPYCWVVLGSEGRREQTFKTDQDNALIYADPTTENSAAAASYFARLGEFAQAALERCGYPPCTGGYMASNPRWRQSLAGWQDTFATWIREGELHSTEDALIFFDMRPVAGGFSLFDKLAANNRESLKDARFFMSVLGAITITVKPPLGFFRTFVLERSGEHKEQLDLKSYGTSPIVNAARLFALDAGVAHSNTVDRLLALQSLPEQDVALLRDLQEAFEFFTLSRLENQLQQARDGQPLNNFISPANSPTCKGTG